jgi:3-hydroxybutyryl-CoA dehydratase
VRIGDTVVARVTVREVNREKKRLVVDTVCTVGDTQVLDGEAKLMVASRAKLAPGNEAAAVVAAE